jgi:hypothetical protein
MCRSILVGDHPARNFGVDSAELGLEMRVVIEQLFSK